MEILCIDFVNSIWYKNHEIFEEVLKNDKFVVKKIINENPIDFIIYEIINSFFI